MKWLESFLVAVTVLWPMMEVSGKEPPNISLQEKKECIGQMEESNAAFSAKDWLQVDIIARRFIQHCSDVEDRRQIADAYADLAIANNELRHFQEALAMALSGITTHYLVTSNHIEKFRALLELHRLDEARSSFKVAESLVRQAMNHNNSDLSEASDESHRALYLSRRGLYRSQLEVIERYRTLLNK